jgi:hypothetical protein
MWQTAVRRGCIGVVASVAGLGVARGATGAGNADTGAGMAGADALPANAAPTTQEDVPPPANLMSLFDKVGLGPKLDAVGIDLYGHVEGGYTKQFLNPNDTLFGRQYDFANNRALLNQAAINVERTISTTSDHFDIGFHVQALEGTDAGFTQTFQSYNGAKGESAAVFDVGGNNSSYQFDIPDAYVDFGIPLGRGVRVRAGRFEFFKPIDPNDRIFYSTTFVYTNVLPKTNTGVTVAYDFNDHAGIEAGFSRGYNITVNDFNGSIDFIGKGHVDLTDSTTLTGTTSVGPELARDSRDYTAVFDAAVSHKINDSVSVLVDGIYAYQFGSSTTSQGYDPFGPADLNLPASYYGASGNIVWQVNAYFSLAGRAEWLRDDGGLLSGNIGRTVTPAFGSPVSRSLYEATIGSTITPFPRDAIGQNLKIRPEVRYDYSNKVFFGPDPFGTPTRKDQLTFGADVIYNF